MPRAFDRWRGPRAAGRAALALTLWTCACAGAETRLDAAADLAYDSNVTRAQLRDDKRADAFVNGRAAASWRADAGESGSVDAGTGVRAAEYFRFSRLSYFALDATAGYRRKLGLGLLAPWVSAAASWSREDYREDSRDSNRIELRLAAGRRWSEALDTSAGYVFDRRYARHDNPVVPFLSGAVWDVKGDTGFVRAGYAPDARWQLDATYAIRRGDVVSTTHRHLAIFLASSAIAESHAFGPDFYDYRLRGTTQAAGTALSYALGAQSSLNLGYAFALTQAAHGLEYRSHLVSATWLYRN